MMNRTHSNIGLWGRRAVSSMVIASTIAGGLAAVSTATAAGKVDQLIVAKCKGDLAKKLKIQANGISVTEAKPVVWPTSALGMPEIDKFYAQAQVSGAKVILKAANREFLYTTGANAIKYGGPVDSWSYSALYLKPVQNEPNLNGDLYQCSLLGTNSVRVASGVTDYYPQADGRILCARRTSRSGYDLLLVNARTPGKETKLSSAFYFGPAALNERATKWAAFARTGLGANPCVLVGRVAAATKPVAYELPDGVRSAENIAWSDDGTVMIVANQNDKRVVLRGTVTGETTEWSQVDWFYFPGADKYVLNKSESLDVSEETEDGKPVVKVATVWFTGDRTELARIEGMKLGGSDLVGPYVFVYGTKSGAPVAYSVRISDGQTLECRPGKVSRILPFEFGPCDSPLRK